MNFIKKHKYPICYIVTIIVSIIYIIVGFRYCSKSVVLDSLQIPTETAKVIRVVDVDLEDYTLSGGDSYVQKTIFFEAEIVTGDRKGETVVAVQEQDTLLVVTPKDVEDGDRVMLVEETYADGEPMWFFAEYNRSDALIWLCLFFFALLLLFGRFKGLNTIVSLVFTCLAVFMVFIPSVLASMDIYISSSITCLFVIFMTLLIVNGPNRKTFCSAMGCLGGLVVTAILTLIMDKVLNLTGLVDQDAQFLLLLNEDNPINLRAVIFGAIIIGALGATMDVSMSISSSLKELSDNMENRTYRRLVKSGFNIGRDIMGTMANTLVLAYIGSSLSVVLLMVSHAGSLMVLFNYEMIVVEIMQALVGSLGILFTIPITSILASFVYNMEKRPVPVDAEAAAANIEVGVTNDSTVAELMSGLDDEPSQADEHELEQ